MPPASRTTVLIVEDDLALRTLLRTALQSAGYAVIAVEDGLAALKRIECDTPDVIVLDMALPRLSGRDVHREMAARAETSQIPIVVVSGTDVSDLDPTEFSSVLRKPVDPDAVVSAVEQGLRRSQRRPEPA